MARLSSSATFLLLYVCHVTHSSAIKPFSNWGNSVHQRVMQHYGCAGMCCSGTNSTCFSYRDQDSTSSPFCYCDESCQNTNDCCSDYSTFCKAVDCEVGRWGPYSQCTVSNNSRIIGTKIRERDVVVFPQNGGRRCPDLSETVACSEKIAKRAKIMPASFGNFRTYSKYNPSMDIRKNLYYNSNRRLEDAAKKRYCVDFVIISQSDECLMESPAEWTRSLKTNSRICVECQRHAINSPDLSCTGDGVHDVVTKWSAVNNGKCHGKWMRVSPNKPLNCECNMGNGQDFIFV